MLVDIHAHIQFNAFKDDAEEVIARAKKAGVFMVAPSSQIDTSRRAIEYAKKYPGRIWAAVGLHPIHLKPAYFDPSEEGAAPFATRVEEFDVDAYRDLAETPEVVGIGETGLDYAEKLQVNEEDRDTQEKVFEEQLVLALDLEKPVIVHCRDGVVDGAPRSAHDDVLRILTYYADKGLLGVSHCFSGTLAQAQQYLDLGFRLSFTGLITFNHSWDEVIRYAPLEGITVETDAPYMTPEPHRGKRNEPAFVRYVAERIAELKDISYEEVARQTMENARALFGLGF